MYRDEGQKREQEMRNNRTILDKIQYLLELVRYLIFVVAPHNGSPST